MRLSNPKSGLSYGWEYRLLWQPKKSIQYFVYWDKSPYFWTCIYTRDHVLPYEDIIYAFNHLKQEYIQVAIVNTNNVPVLIYFQEILSKTNNLKTILWFPVGLSYFIIANWQNNSGENISDFSDANKIFFSCWISFISKYFQLLCVFIPLF